MATRGQNIKLAIFLLSTGGALLLLLVAFLGFTFWQNVAPYYVLVPDSVEGLERGSPVNIRGVRVGSVGEFELYPDGKPGVRVTLEIDSDVPVSSDARASIKFQGLTGIKLVDLVEGSPEAPPLSPGSYIPYGATALQKITDHADELIEASVLLLGRANELLARLVAMAGAVDTERLNETFEQGGELLAGLTETNAELRELIEGSQRQIGRVLGQTNRTLSQVDKFLASAGGTTEQLARSTQEIQQLVRASADPLRTTAYNLRAASESFRELGRTLAQQPSSLLFSDPPPERKLP